MGRVMSRACPVIEAAITRTERSAGWRLDDLQFRASGEGVVNVSAHGWVDLRLGKSAGSTHVAALASMVEFAEHDHRMAQHFGQIPGRVGSYRTDLGEGEGRQLQHEPGSFGRGEPGDGGEPATDQRGECGGVEDLAADHAVEWVATG